MDPNITFALASGAVVVIVLYIRWFIASLPVTRKVRLHVLQHVIELLLDDQTRLYTEKEPSWYRLASFRFHIPRQRKVVAVKLPGIAGGEIPRIEIRRRSLERKSTHLLYKMEEDNTGTYIVFPEPIAFAFHDDEDIRLELHQRIATMEGKEETEFLYISFQWKEEPALIHT